MFGREQRRAGVVLRVAAVAGVACAGVVVLLGALGAPRAVLVGTALSGLLSVAGGLVLLRPPASAVPPPVPRPQLWFAAALVVQGVGQLVHAGSVLRAPTGYDAPFPTPGNLLALATAPLAVAGLVAFARAVPGLTGAALPAVRLLLDALLLALALVLVLWRSVFLDHLAAAPAATLLNDVTLVADFVTAGLAGLLALRRPTRPLLVAAAGLACVLAGQVLVQERALPPIAPGSWPGLALLCLGWPLVAAGVLEHRPPSARAALDPPLEAEGRITAATTTATVLLLVAGVVEIFVGPPVDAVSLVLVLVLVAVVWVREVLAARQRAALLRRLHAEATRDPLTGLANRRELTRRLAQPGAQPWCLLTLDLDAFKTVNDVLGHDTGDRLLRAVAARLGDVAPSRALVARVGGDEFAVLLPSAVDEAQRLGEALVAAVRRACGDVPGVDRVGVSASVGLAEVGPAVPATAGGAPTPDPLSALSAAGAAQRLAKSAGHDRVQVFDDAAARARRRRLTVEERLRGAIAEGALQLHYQPIVELDGGRLAGVEALARWTDDVLGAVAPEEFIAVAEDSGLVVPLGELVLHRAVEQAVTAGLPAAGIRVSCNVSPLQLRVPGFHRVVEEALAAHRMPPASVVVEVTEAALVEEEGTSVRTLRRLVELGVTVAIDDFGTGYSALGYLRRLPAQILKIDKSLTASLVEEHRARAITRAVTELAGAIGLSVVVEGVETQDVADLVRAMGADYGQGSLFGRPTPLEQVPGLRAALAGLPLAPIALPAEVPARRRADA